MAPRIIGSCSTCGRTLYEDVDHNCRPTAKQRSARKQENKKKTGKK